jgi:hypothetical protein
MKLAETIGSLSLSFLLTFSCAVSMDCKQDFSMQQKFSLLFHVNFDRGNVVCVVGIQG